jgi:hypothetical protein
MGPGRKLSSRLPVSAGVGVFLHQVGAGDIRRHQVRRELDARKFEIQYLGDGVDQQRLGKAGHADDQAVAAGQYGQHDLFDDRVLADDQLAQFAAQLVVAPDQILGEFDIVGGLQGFCLLHVLIHRWTSCAVWDAPGPVAGGCNRSVASATVPPARRASLRARRAAIPARAEN